jgi:hypothetical protein
MRRFGIDWASDDRPEHEAILRRQFVVRDQEEFITSFDPRDGGTLRETIADLMEHFHAPDGEGYADTDMVVWRDGRIVAVVRRGEDGEPQATIFGRDAY